MTVTGGIVATLVTGFVYAFAAVFIWATFLRTRLHQGYRRLQIAERTVFEQRSSWGEKAIGVAFLAVGLVAGDAIANTAIDAGFGWHWLLWLPLLAMFGIHLASIGLFLLIGRVQVVVDRAVGTLRRAALLGPVPFWGDRKPLAEFHGVQVDVQRRGTFGGSWTWVVSLRRQGDPIEIGSGDEQVAQRIAAELSACMVIDPFPDVAAR